MEYKCAKCKEAIRTDISTIGIQCEKCGSRIFFKTRPSVKKAVRSR